MAGITAANREPITGINVTPFVDIVLVLLIIFMATSSYIVNPAIEVDLPEAAAGGDTVETTLALVLTKDGRLYLNGRSTTDAEVAQHCRETSEKNPKIQAIIAADGASRHQEVIRLIDLVKQNGVHSFALNIDTPEPSAAQ